MSAVTAVIITCDQPMALSIASVRRQMDIDNIIVHQRAPERLSDQPLINKYRNCSLNREAARIEALASKSDWFLFVDDDVELPNDALSSLLNTGLPVVCGWYPILGTSFGAGQYRYPLGLWVKDHTFMNYTWVHRNVVRTDSVALGCALISRRILEQISFESGTDLFCKCAITGRRMVVGECGMFGNRLAELGLTAYATEHVICRHMDRHVNKACGETSNPRFWLM